MAAVIPGGDTETADSNAEKLDSPELEPIADTTAALPNKPGPVAVLD